MAIRIRRSTTEATPTGLAEGQPAYSFQSGNLFVGGPDSTVVKIGGNTDVTKLAGIEAGAQVNTVTSVAGRTGAVTLTHADLSDFNDEVDARIVLADLADLADVHNASPSDGQVLTWDNANSRWAPAAAGSGVTTFIALNDTPANFTSSGGFFLRVNSGANAVEFTQDVDDGTF